jgi:hypothetical protein
MKVGKNKPKSLDIPGYVQELIIKTSHNLEFGILPTSGDLQEHSV